MNYSEVALEKHKEWAGKIEVAVRCPVDTKQALSVAYTPGVAAPCLEIQKNVDLSYTYTRRANTVAVITDGTAVLGLGDIGPEAGMPVMEGKCALFKAFGGVDAIPLCVRSKDVDEIVKTVSLIAGSFGGINLEDISAPRCFEIEKKLKQVCDIPVFHDDQHGTAIVASAALINALKLVKKDMKEIKMIINGAGSAGISICKLLLSIGVKNITLVDRNGAIARDKAGQTAAQDEMALVTNPENKTGSLKEVIVGADVFLGVSAPDVLSSEMVGSMAKDAIVFAMANPNPEIAYDKAKEAGAAVVGTGRSDFPNQINNLLAFPGIFRGALDVRASDINEQMKIAAAYAIASLVEENELATDYILPSALDKRVAPQVALAVAKAAVLSNVARV